MSKENLDQFIQKVTDSEEIQARIGEEIDADSLIALGAEHGCEFTADDLTADAELSDEELDGVAGGAYNDDIRSMTTPDPYMFRICVVNEVAKISKSRAQQDAKKSFASAVAN